MEHKVIKHYLSAVKKETLISGKKQKEFFAILKENLSNYVLENPDADYKDLEEIFGTPKEVAESYYQSLDEKEITNAINIKKKSFKIIVAAVILIVAIISILKIQYYYDLHKDIPVYRIDEIEYLEDVDFEDIKDNQE